MRPELPQERTRNSECEPQYYAKVFCVFHERVHQYTCCQKGEARTRREAIGVPAVHFFEKGEDGIYSRTSILHSGKEGWLLDPVGIPEGG